MKKFAIAALAASLSLGAMAATAPASAQSFGFSFNTGDVAFAYRDGYWDRDHNWHNWRNGREAREYRRVYRDHYYDAYHHRLRNMGWRDDDRDGIPNRYDRHPENPYRP